MKDERVASFRKALEGLIESLDATVRVTRWAEDAEAIPEPLKESASRLVARLGAADRYASGGFKGSVADTARVSAMCTAMRRLDVAYVAYRQRLETRERETAAMTLDTAIEEVKADARHWS